MLWRVACVLEVQKLIAAAAGGFAWRRCCRCSVQGIAGGGVLAAPIACTIEIACVNGIVLVGGYGACVDPSAAAAAPGL